MIVMYEFGIDSRFLIRTRKGTAHIEDDPLEVLDSIDLTVGVDFRIVLTDLLVRDPNEIVIFTYESFDKYLKNILTCQFRSCTNTCRPGRRFCKEHLGFRCISCGEQATKRCSYIGCNKPICDKCTSETAEIWNENSKGEKFLNGVKHTHPRKDRWITS